MLPLIYRLLKKHLNLEIVQIKKIAINLPVISLRGILMLYHNLIYKGSKYRIPTGIDFNASYTEIIILIKL